MKGFIACTLAVAPLFASSELKRPIHFSYTFDEETGCLGAPLVLADLKKRNLNIEYFSIGLLNFRMYGMAHSLPSLHIFDSGQWLLFSTFFPILPIFFIAFPYIPKVPTLNFLNFFDKRPSS